MSKKPEILQTKVIAETRHFCIEQLDLRFSNGVEVVYERFVTPRPGAVLIVPMLDNSTVLMIREYAAGVHRYELALPKGGMAADESILDAANRELMEEVGYGANKLTHLTTLTTAPGYHNSTIHVVLAEELYENRLQGDEPEEIEVIPWRLDKLSELTAHEECTEGRSIAALYMAREVISASKEE